MDDSRLLPPSDENADHLNARALSADELVALVHRYYPSANGDKMRDAYAFSREMHEGQKRHSGRPYYEHPVAVATILAGLHLDVDTIITALLHDTVEDTSATLDEIRKRYGDDVAELVDGVTKLTQVSRSRGVVARQAENLQKFVLAISRDVRVLLVKLADRLHNMRTLSVVPKPESRERVARETMEIYAPLARRIGLHRVCGELENLAFMHVNPSAYESVRRRVAMVRAERSKAVDQVSAEITRKLRVSGVDAVVFGREKSAYSIWRKLERRGIDFDDLADIYAFRVIVDSEEECYRVLGLIHRTWRCVPERFKDFISTPKPNSYRSIHTTVVGPENYRVEIQIRTHEMDLVAENGVAAHWKYKDKSYSYDADAARRAGGDPLERLRGLVELLEHGATPEEFLEHAKLEMFSDQVFAFTPRGEVISLPSQATPLDFAYAVHTDIGDTCVGAKINGRQRPLRTQLANGDVVEIIRAATPAPMPGWEDLAVTGRARSAIRRLIRRSERGEFMRIGRAVAEHAFRREKLNLGDYQLADALVRLGLEDEETLFEHLGRRRLTGADLLDAVFPGRERAEGSEPGAVDLISDEKAPLYVRGEGLTPGVGLHFSSCCSPLPGDRIVGVLQPERGVDVHTIDCDVLAKYEDEQDRWVDLGWTRQASDRTVSVGRVTATVDNARGALAEITGSVGRSGGNITGVRILNRSADFFEMSFDIEVADLRHLSQVIAAMRACASVVSARRSMDVGAEEGPS